MTDLDAGGLPQDPSLAAAAAALEAHAFAGEVWDAGFRLVYLSGEYRSMAAGGRAPVSLAGVGEFILSAALTDVRESWPAGLSVESFHASLREWAGYIVGAAPGGRSGVIANADPRFHDILEDVEAEAPPAAWGTRVGIRFGNETISNDVLCVRLTRPDGSLAGFVSVLKPQVRATVLAMLATGDAQLFERMSGLLQPGRRPAAIVFADLENSSVLARRLSTPAYFALIRRLVSRADRVIVAASGIVGKHAGDGVTAFVLAEQAGSESAAVRGCIEAMRGIQVAAREAADRSGLDPGDVTMRFGLHWGATVYVGRLMTSGRAEVTALGDEVNEAARIEACATGGRALASKALIERLEPADAEVLGIDTANVDYTPVTQLATATDKARRDAPAIPVCDLNRPPAGPDWPATSAHGESRT